MTETFKALNQALALGTEVAFHASEQPEAKAVISMFGDRTYAQLNARTNQLVRMLRDRGVGPGSAIAVVSRNRPEFVEALSAANCGGLRFTPVNFHLTADEAGYVIDNCEAQAVIYDAELGTANAALDHAQHCAVRLAIGGAIEGFEDYETAIEPFTGDSISDPQRGTAMLYTSGTTGHPKGVHRREQAAPTAEAAIMMAGGAGAVSLCTGPMYHAAPLGFNVSSPLRCGATMVLMDKWDAEQTLALIEEHKVTHTHMVATMFHRLLQLPAQLRDKYDLTSLQFVVHGAAPCPLDVKRRMIEWFGPIVHEYYAGTEGGNRYTIDSETWLRKPGSVGKSLVPEDTRILSDDGEEVVPGETGYIYFRAPKVGRFEYFKAQEKTAQTYQGDWFTLGDMGYLDHEGFLYLTGRSAEVIISGGVNVYPQEIDDIFLKHPAVLDACTIGVPSDEWGEEVKTLVQLAAGTEPSEALSESLIAHARHSLAAFKCPRSVYFVEHLPRLPSGKVQRGVARARYWQDQERDI